MIREIQQQEVQCRPSSNVLGEAFQTKIDADVAVFLAKGGKVEVVANSATAEPFRMRTREDQLADQKRKFKINNGEDLV